MLRSLLCAAMFGLSACMLPTAAGLGGDGRLPLKAGLIEQDAKLQLVALNKPWLATELRTSFHSKLASATLSLGTLLDLRPYDIRVSGDLRVRLYEDGPEGWGLAMVMGAGLYPTFRARSDAFPSVSSAGNWGVDGGLIVSSPRWKGLRAYGGLRLNPVHSRSADMFFAYTNLAAGLSWSTQSGFTAALEAGGLHLSTLPKPDFSTLADSYFLGSISIGYVFGVREKGASGGGRKCTGAVGGGKSGRPCSVARSKVSRRVKERARLHPEQHKEAKP